MFSKEHRVSTSEFDTYFAAGKRFHSPQVQLIYTPHSDLKVSVVIPKKVVKTSVGRNRVKRAVLLHLKKVLRDATGVYIFIFKKGFSGTVDEVLCSELDTVVGQVAKKG